MVRRRLAIIRLCSFAVNSSGLDTLHVDGPRAIASGEGVVETVCSHDCSESTPGYWRSESRRCRDMCPSALATRAISSSVNRECSGSVSNVGQIEVEFGSDDA